MTYNQTSDDKWYFAYGSNLLEDQKKERTGDIRKAIKCYLPGYKFVFNKRGSCGEIYANILPDDNEKVWGVIYLCNPEAIKEMDVSEGVAKGHYHHIDVEVITDDGEKVSAMTYEAGSDYIVLDGKPSKEYLKKIIEGAENHGLPEDYIQYIENIAT